MTDNRIRHVEPAGYSDISGRSFIFYLFSLKLEKDIFTKFELRYHLFYSMLNASTRLAFDLRFHSFSLSLGKGFRTKFELRYHSFSLSAQCLYFFIISIYNIICIVSCISACSHIWTCTCCLLSLFIHFCE